MIPYTTGAFIVALLGAMAAALRNLVPARCGGPVAALLLLAYFAGVSTVSPPGSSPRRKLKSTPSTFLPLGCSAKMSRFAAW